jgi:hypothetical protein
MGRAVRATAETARRDSMAGDVECLELYMCCQVWEGGRRELERLALLLQCARLTLPNGADGVRSATVAFPLACSDSSWATRPARDA